MYSHGLRLLLTRCKVCSVNCCFDYITKARYSNSLKSFLFNIQYNNFLLTIGKHGAMLRNVTCN